MARLRQDPFTWQWVITGETSPASPSAGPAPPTPEARLRPPAGGAGEQASGPADPAATGTEALRGAGCPFCPAQQAAARESVLSERPAGADWRVRVIADRAPLLRVEGDLDRTAEGLFDSMNAVGAHEIIIEGQEHAATPASLPHELWCSLLEVFRDRISDRKRDPRFRYVEVFQNHGPLAGALVSHPHAQLIAAPVLPHRVERELRAAAHHYHLKQRCLYCDLIRQETHTPQRVVADQDGFLLLCPYASRFPYEMWLLPRRHHASFEAATAGADVRAALAGVLQTALRKAERVAASFHFFLHTEPSRRLPPVLAERWRTLSEDYHWHIEILPRLEARRKYLHEEEFYLNPVLPEEAARTLRQL
ncbi:MAG: galactose-1-phosphate uridylyltransferase [Terriglobia bacterium]